MPIYTGPYANSGIPNALKALGSAGDRVEGVAAVLENPLSNRAACRQPLSRGLCLDAAEIIESRAGLLTPIDPT